MTVKNKAVKEYGGSLPLFTSSREEGFSETGLPTVGLLSRLTCLYYLFWGQHLHVLAYNPHHPLHLLLDRRTFRFRRVVRIVYLPPNLAKEVLHHRRAVDDDEPARRGTHVLEVVPGHGGDGHDVTCPDPHRAQGVVLVHRANLELALLEEEDLRVGVPVQNRGTAAGRD